jgi:hypothetical protein
MRLIPPAHDIPYIMPISIITSPVDHLLNQSDEEDWPQTTPLWESAISHGTGPQNVQELLDPTTVTTQAKRTRFWHHAQTSIVTSCVALVMVCYLRLSFGFHTKQGSISTIGVPSSDCNIVFIRSMLNSFFRLGFYIIRNYCVTSTTDI